MLQISANDKLLTVGQVPERLPKRSDRPLSVGTIRRWVSEGRLESVQIGGRRLVPTSALQRFAKTEPDEHHFTLGEVTAVFPLSSGRRISIRTVQRWITKGVDGVRLRSVQIGGRRLVPLSALNQFLADLNDGQASGLQLTRLAAAVERLKKLGFSINGYGDGSSQDSQATQKRTASTRAADCAVPEARSIDQTQ